MRAVTMRGASVSGMSFRVPRRSFEPDRPAHAAERAVRWHVAGEPAAAKVVDELVEGGGADVAEEAPVHGQARRPAAVGDALDLFEGELAVGGRRPGLDAQPLFRV